VTHVVVKPMGASLVHPQEHIVVGAEVAFAIQMSHAAETRDVVRPGFPAVIRVVARSDRQNLSRLFRILNFLFAVKL